MNTAFDEIKVKLDEFLSTSFPAGCAGKEIQGIVLVELDAYASGAVGTFVGNGGKLDPHNQGILNDCFRELQVVVSQLSGDGKAYFEKLQNLTAMVLREAQTSHV